jgi:hypothetical protein
VRNSTVLNIKSLGLKKGSSPMVRCLRDVEDIQKRLCENLTCIFTINL